MRGQLARGGGLAGLSGVAGGDVRDMEAAARREAALAIEVFVYQVKKTIGEYAAAMGGMEAVAFTGGIGENSARLRSRCCAGLEFLGIELDGGRTRGAGDRVVSSDRCASRRAGARHERGVGGGTPGIPVSERRAQPDGAPEA